MLKLLALLLFSAPMLSRADGPKPAAGGLDKSVIDEQIKKAIPQLRECYTNESKKAGGQKEGRLVMKFLIGADGGVTEAKAEDSTFQNAEFVDCMAKAVKAITFPPPAGGGVVEVSYPFAFNSGAEEAKMPAVAPKKKKGK